MTFGAPHLLHKIFSWNISDVVVFANLEYGIIGGGGNNRGM